VDYLQEMLVGIRRERQNTDELLTGITEGLKAVAKRLDVAVCCLSQMNRGAENRADHRPSMGELRGSGGIEQAADVIALLYREFQYKSDRTDLINQVEINIAKNRQGATGSFSVKLLGDICSMEDL
jgi:replicative DNA helicase